MSCIVVIGNPVGGFRFVGPFETNDEAIDFGNDIGEGDWWIADLEAPE
jgi:hypothetical protein